MKEQKMVLRKQLIREREALSPEIIAENSRLIVSRLMAFEPLLAQLRKQESVPIGLYAACRGEPDVRPLAEFLIAQGAIVAFPAIVGRLSDRHICFGVYDPACPLDQFLQPGCFGVSEPPESSLLPVCQLMSVLIVPGVAFDEQGGRMGFGKGFYDKMIASLPQPPLLIGVAHPFQVQAQQLPMNSYDQRMDYIILPDRTIVVQ